MNKQALSIEQMQHLQKLGVDTSKASMCWRRISRYANGEVANSPWRIILNNGSSKEYNVEYETIPTFTLQDILELLPYKIVASYLLIGKKSFNGYIQFYVEYSNFGGYAFPIFKGDNLIDVAYEMLCWCIEKHHINKED